MLAIVVVGRLAALARPAVRPPLVPARLPLAAPLGFFAVLAGWTTTEVGRQPWTVYGLLRTADSVTPSLAGADVRAVTRRLCAGLSRSSSRRPRLMARHRARGAAEPDIASRRGRKRPADATRAGASGARRGETHHERRRSTSFRSGPFILGLGRLPLCAAGRLRSRRRHPLRLRPGSAIAQPDDGLDRADLGRQRDLAGPGRRRPDGRVSAGLRDHHPGGLFPDSGHAAGTGVPRRRVRVPLPRRRAPELLGSRLLPTARCSRPSRRAWCSAPSSRASRSRAAIRRRQPRLLHAVLAVDRPRLSSATGCWAQAGWC